MKQLVNMPLLDSVLSEYEEDGVNYKRKGLLLDIDHLFCTNVDIRNESEGIEYVLQKMEEHYEFLKYIKAIHLHKSISGNYVKNNTGVFYIDILILIVYTFN
ncbi:MAG: hypothetical protein ACTTH0_01590 [Eubacteriales bacterium]